MTPLTTLSDFHKRLAEDARYKLVLANAFKYYYGQTPHSSMTPEKWLIHLETRINETKDGTCKNIVISLNRAIERLPMIFDDKLISAHKINSFSSNGRIIDDE